MQMQILVLLMAAVVFSAPRLFAEEQASAATPEQVSETSTVTIEYTVKDSKGKVVDSNVGKKPLTFDMEKHQIIPGLERRLVGMKVGEEKEIKVPAKEAYGEVQDELIIEVPLEKLPQGVKVGDMLQMQSADGRVYPCRVAEINDKTARLDLNHPLAGQDLTFDVKILKVKE